MSQDITKTEETKVVQTEVPTPLYEQFKTATDERGMTIKQAAAEAIREFTYRYQPIDPDDPLFAPLRWDDEDIAQSDDASERIDEIAYGDLDADGA